MMTTFERRRRIVDLLREKSSLTVTELTTLLEVSEGTIRNDLTALAESQQLMRVRGGAVLHDNLQNNSPIFETRARTNAQAKKRIARWAADMVEDGDSIILDASSTVFHMASFLYNRQRITVFTHGIEVARVLAKNPSNTVILMGGELRPDGTSVTGHLGAKFLENLHVKTAFVSCSGFSVDAGLTEVNIQDIPLKIEMLTCADQVVALIDSSKFGQVTLSSFAKINQISRVVTDNNIEDQYIEQLRHTQTNLTICGETTASSFTPVDAKLSHHKIGFANLSEEIPFAVDVRRGLELAAKNKGNIELIVADNQLDGQVAWHMAERLIEKEVDLVIEYQIDEKMGNLIMNKFRQQDIPVIAVDIPIVGASFLGANNYQAGHIAGLALGEWVNTYWSGHLDRLIILEEHRAGPLPEARIQGQLDGVQDIIGEIPQARVIYLNSGSKTEICKQEVGRILEKYPDEHQFAVISYNDDTALGALQAARQADREEDMVIVGQGADRSVRPEIRRPDSRIIGSTAFRPEKYGEKLLEIALKILRGEAVPPATYIEHVFINSENIDLYYPE